MCPRRLGSLFSRRAGDRVFVDVSHAAMQLQFFHHRTRTAGRASYLSPDVTCGTRDHDSIDDKSHSSGDTVAPSMIPYPTRVQGLSTQTLRNLIIHIHLLSSPVQS